MSIKPHILCLEIEAPKKHGGHQLTQEARATSKNNHCASVCVSTLAGAQSSPLSSAACNHEDLSSLSVSRLCCCRDLDRYLAHLEDRLQSGSSLSSPLRSNQGISIRVQSSFARCPVSSRIARPNAALAPHLNSIRRLRDPVFAHHEAGRQGAPTLLPFGNLLPLQLPLRLGLEYHGDL